MPTFERFHRIVGKGSLPALLAPALMLAVAACGAGGPSDEPANELSEDASTPSAEPSSATTDAEASVFFTQPQDGATVTSPVTVTFNADNIEIGAVPEVVEAPRDGVVHHHLGVDTDCLPAGTQVPQADPWIHFGDGSNEIEMQLEPGEHRLVVQAGNDEHTTIEGLCQTITITVEGEG